MALDKKERSRLIIMGIGLIKLITTVSMKDEMTDDDRKELLDELRKYANFLAKAVLD
jgi:hypothetical protein